MLRFALVIICSLVITGTYAQQVQKGIVLENKAHVALSGVTVQNLSTTHIVVTDKEGKFSILAKLNDLLVFNAIGYRPDTVLLTDLHEREVFMDPVSHMLNEVKVNGTGNVNGGALTNGQDQLFRNQTMTYQRDANGVAKGGVNFRVWSSKSAERDRKKNAELEQKNTVSTEIAKAFSRENVSKYIPLKDKELDSFIMRYSPNVETYVDADFHLVNYLNKCYKEFMLLPADERQKTSIFN